MRVIFREGKVKHALAGFESGFHGAFADDGAAHFEAMFEEDLFCFLDLLLCWWHDGKLVSERHNVRGQNVLVFLGFFADRG